MILFKSIVVCLLTLAAGVSAAQRPNVIVLLADDLGCGDLGCYGGPVKTPALDGLAAQGVRFTDFHAGAAVCSPSRATLLTGRQHIRTGIYQVLQDTMHNAHLLEREVTIAEVLKQAGYGTAHFGKWHLGLTTGNRKKPSPTEHGFDYWFGLANGAGPSQKDPVNFIRNGKRVGPLKGYSCQIVVDDAMRWLDEERAKDKPFFLNIWFNEPHSVLAAPDEIVSRYGDLNDPAALYSGAIDNTDRAITRLAAKLKDMGELENTLIIYSSDNGSYRDDRNRGLRGAKGSNLEGGIRSPGIFYWPRGIPGGRIEKEPAGSVDLLPTICGLLDIAKPNGVRLDGTDLAPLLTGRGSFQRQQPLLWINPGNDHIATLRDGRYALIAYRDYKLPQDQPAMSAVFNQIVKLVRKQGGKPTDAEVRTRIFNQDFAEPEARRLSTQYVMLNTFQESWIPLIKTGGFSRFELYDLDADPRQQKNILAQQPEVVARLKKQLLELHASIIADAPDWLTPEEIAAEKKTREVLAESVETRAVHQPKTLWEEIDARPLPAGYDLKTHQEYVDARMAKLTAEQRGRIGRLWQEKRKADPNMPNRGMAFVKIMEFVAAGEPPAAAEAKPKAREGASARPQSGAPGQRKPNVLFIAVDDLNDYVGCLGGHPQAKTPNIDRLAAKGVLFEQAHCAAPLCNPSRTAIMTGLRPSTTGIYGNEEWFRDIPKYADWVTLPQYFRQHGYSVAGGGKLYHMADGKFSDPIAWEERYSLKTGTSEPPVAQRYRHGLKANFSNPILQRLIDWAPIDQPAEATADWKTAAGAAEILSRNHDKPFFIGCGIFRPHLPWYVPKKYFDMHPLDAIQLPAHMTNELAGVPTMGRKIPGTEFEILKTHGMWKQMVQAYLAASSFADACVGHVLDALEKSPHRDNTIVVLWGDHGYHVGEKDHLEKSALWGQTTRTPLIIHVPGASRSQARCPRPVSLVDLYPTLIELCGLPKRDDLDGRSLAPLVRHPETDWPYPALITHSPRWLGINHAVRSQQFHYIHYNDGGEELYDMTRDPHQFNNLAADPALAGIKSGLGKWLPNTNAEHFRPAAPATTEVKR